MRLHRLYACCVALLWLRNVLALPDLSSESTSSAQHGRSVSVGSPARQNPARAVWTAALQLEQQQQQQKQSAAQTDGRHATEGHAAQSRLLTQEQTAPVALVRDTLQQLLSANTRAENQAVSSQLHRSRSFTDDVPAHAALRKQRATLSTDADARHMLPASAQLPRQAGRQLAVQGLQRRVIDSGPALAGDKRPSTTELTASDASSSTMSRLDGRASAAVRLGPDPRSEKLVWRQGFSLAHGSGARTDSIDPDNLGTEKEVQTQQIRKHAEGGVATSVFGRDTVVNMPLADASMREVPSSLGSESSVVPSGGASAVTSQGSRFSLGAAEAAPGADAWWRRVRQDPEQCGIVDAQPSELLRELDDYAPEACSKLCRVTAGCNAWVSCTDSRGCEHEGRALQRGACLLLAANLRPRREPTLDDIAAPGGFFSYQAGHLKGDMYLRPPHVTVATAIEPCDPTGPTPAHKNWRHANWLNWVSVVNKQDYARLQGFDFMVVAIQENRTKVDIILEVLDATAGRQHLDWVLWAEQNALVLNPAFTFPYSRYDAAGRSIIMYGNPERTVAGHVNGFDPGVVLMRNTRKVRRFWQAVQETLQDTALMTKGLQTLKDINAQNDGLNYRNAMALMFSAAPERWLGPGSLLHFEQKYCISCYYDGADLQSPTMFVTHFIDVSHCNDFSLAKDDGRWPAYNELFLQVYRLSRCKLTVALRHSEPRAIAAAAQELVGTRLQAVVATPGKFNRRMSVASCRHSCAITSGCSAWVYCWEPNGCDDGRDVRPDVYPDKACELFAAPTDRLLHREGRGPMFSSSSTGFVASALGGLSTEELRRQVHGRDMPKVVIATAIPSDPCAFPTADHMYALGVANKQDYAHAHAWELHLSARLIDLAVTAGNWNKESMIRKVLKETRSQFATIPKAGAAEWVWWMDADALIADMTVVPRFSDYEGFDLVVWGDRAQLMAGDMNAGINCGVMLIRNTEWAAAFFEDVGQYAYMHRATIEEHMRPILEKEVFPLVSGFYDTPFIAWLLKTRPDYMAKVFFEDQIGINRHFAAIEWGSETPPLVSHFAGCTFCNPPMGKLEERTVTACSEEWYKTYVHSRCTLEQHFGGQRACEYARQDLSWLDIRLGE